jgi:hypothetical protein
MTSRHEEGQLYATIDTILHADFIDTKLYLDWETPKRKGAIHMSQRSKIPYCKGRLHSPTIPRIDVNFLTSHMLGLIIPRVSFLLVVTEICFVCVR